MTKLALALTLVGSFSAWGQDAISAHSGMIHYIEGTVRLDGDPVEMKFAQFPEVRNDHVLSTEQGRAEVLMTPGVILRLSEDSSFKMISNQLSDTKIEIQSGDAVMEVDDLPKDNAITVQFLGTSTSLTRNGLYRFDAERKRIRVYQGLAVTTLGEDTVRARTSKEIQVADGKLSTEFFDSKDTDPFYRWAERRSEYIATANLSAARQAGSMGLVSSPSTWAWNPWYGMFTFMPGYGYGGYNGFGYSPFGYNYYSPLTVGYALPVSGYYGGGTARQIPVSRGSVGSISSGGASLNPQRASISSSSSASPMVTSRGAGPSSTGGVSTAGPTSSPTVSSGSSSVSSGTVSRGASMATGGGGGRR